jgi:hypothetical protein
MNQRVSHSNLPEFGATKSQTSAILYQEPTLEETKPQHKPLVELAKNFAAGTLLMISIFSIGLLILKGCADDVEHQKAMAVKHQMQFGSGK